MKLTSFQELMDKERWGIIKKFQNEYKTKEEKEKVLKEMTDKDINFLIYCSDNIDACIFYSSFLKNKN